MTPLLSLYGFVILMNVPVPSDRSLRMYCPFCSTNLISRCLLPTPSSLGGKLKSLYIYSLLELCPKYTIPSCLMFPLIPVASILISVLSRLGPSTLCWCSYFDQQAWLLLSLVCANVVNFIFFALQHLYIWYLASLLALAFGRFVWEVFFWWVATHAWLSQIRERHVLFFEHHVAWADWSALLIKTHTAGFIWEGDPVLAIGSLTYPKAAHGMT